MRKIVNLLVLLLLLPIPGSGVLLLLIADKKTLLSIIKGEVNIIKCLVNKYAERK
jgi:hypothetical protein